MTAVDTNVLVRVITNDDRAQAARAVAFLRRQDMVFVSKTVLLELEWVLRSAYRIRREDIALALRRLGEVSNAEFEDQAAVSQAISWLSQGMDFADALHLASAGRESDFATFDAALRRKARRLNAGNLIAP